jgi:hypothetical protein
MTSAIVGRGTSAALDAKVPSARVHRWACPAMLIWTTRAVGPSIGPLRGVARSGRPVGASRVSGQPVFAGAAANSSYAAHARGP